MDFGVLGPLLIRTSGGTLRLPSAKQRALLAVLLLEAPHDVSAERLIDELWGEAPPATAAKSLQMHVSHLRRALGPAERIATRPAGYALEIDPGALDVRRFDAHLASARELRAAGDAPGALGALRDALALWRGPALADVTLLGPSAPEADRLEGLRAVAVEERIEVELERGAGAALVPELEALVAAHPYRERMHALLMRALYRAGRQADALEAFRRARAVLVDDLGIEPGPDLIQLEAAILAQDPALAPQPVSAPAERPRGPIAALPSSPKPTQPPRAHAGATTVPRPVSSILGREAELARALDMLTRPQVRLVTLTGAGGIGKTRLALELAARLGARSRLVELAAIADPARVVPAIAAALGAGEGSEDAIAAALGGLGAVLFLDNFEQVLEAAPAVARLLGGAPELKVVVTSRAPLRIAGEHELPVPPLRPEQAAELFIHRVREGDPGFAPSPDEVEVITAICARIDGLPLAIELAAARTRVLTPREILERVGHRLDMLTAGRRDAPERHRTLRATIAWSHDLLTPREQRLFAELAVFHGGWPLAGAEAVAGEDVLDHLSALVDHSLAVRDRDRFAMLETVREYALERLSALPDADSVRRRHARWCATFAEAAEWELEGPEQPAWFARLDAEQENLRAACAWSVAAGAPEVALRIGGTTWRYWLARVAAAEMAGVLRSALAGGDGEPALRAKALNATGVLAGATDDFDAARACFAEAAALACDQGERRQRARALGNLGLIAWFEHDYAVARARYSESAEIWDELGDVSGQSLMLQNLALVHQVLGELDRALPMLEESIGLARRAGDRLRIAATLGALARLLLFRRHGDPRTPALLHEALELLAEVGERLQTAECLELVAHFSVTAGDPSTGAALIGAADAERERIGADRKPDERPYFEQTAGELQHALGSEPYARLRADGQTLSFEAAVALAMSCTEPERGDNVTPLAARRAPEPAPARRVAARRR